MADKVLVLEYGDGDGIFHALEHTGIEILQMLRKGATLRCRDNGSEMAQPLCGDYGFVFLASDGHHLLETVQGWWILGGVSQDEIEAITAAHTK